MELQTRNLEFESLWDNIPGGMYQCLNDDYLTLVFVSNSFSNLLGFSREELMELFHFRLMEMILLEDRESVRHAITQQLSCGDTIESEFRIRRKDGQPMWIYAKGKLVSSQGGVDCFYCALLENPERKEEREKLRLSLDRHDLIMNQTTDIIFEWDIANDTLSFSSNWFKKFGYTPIQTEISRLL